MTLWRTAGLLWLACAAFAAHAQDTSPAALADAAIQKLNTAHTQLSAAKDAPDRVQALTAVITAYEDGLEAMRAGLRQATIHQADLAQEFESESARVSALLAALIAIKPEASAEALVHPSGPLARVRAGMLVSALMPQLQAQARALEIQLEEATILRSLQEDAISTLSKGLKNMQTARVELSQAISTRTDIPSRLVTDPARVQDLIDASETLEAFASSLAVMDVVDGITPLPNIDATKGTWPLPAQGAVQHEFGATDAAGVTRTGWLYKTPALSLVRSPITATIRYHGAFLNYANVIILEPGNDVLLILAGLDEVYGQVGDVVRAGAPVGLMSGTSLALDDFIKNATDGTGTKLSETLYIEIRQGGQPVSPAQWFAQ